MNTITAPIATETPVVPTPAPESTPVEPGTGETPANQPTTADQLRDVKLAQLIPQRSKFNVIVELGHAKIVELVKENLTDVSRVKGEQSNLKGTAKFVGKLQAAMEITWADGVLKRMFPSGMSFTAYHQLVTRTKANPEGSKPWNHAYPCAVVFRDLVLAGRLTEEVFDRRAAEWDATASVILNLVIKNGGNLKDSPEVECIVDIYNNAPDKEGAKMLRAIKAGLKGAVEGEPGDEKLLTVDDMRNADVLVRAVCQREYEANGNKFAGLVIAAEAVAHYTANEKREAYLRQLWRALNTALDAIPSDLLDQFLGEINAETVAKAMDAKSPKSQKAA